jgi:hypothetical protein
MNKSRMLACIVIQGGYHYLSMFLTIYQPLNLTSLISHVDFNSIDLNLVSYRNII